MNYIPGYEKLALVLEQAYEQATAGKGAERHARGNPFHEQHMQTISNLLDSDRGMAFQAIKKLTEGLDFTDPDRRERELLGVIVYVAGIIVWHQAQQPTVRETRAVVEAEPEHQHMVGALSDGTIKIYFGEQPEQCPQAVPPSCCPDCGAPEGDLHYVLCPRLPVPEEHAKAVEEAFAAEQALQDFGTCADCHKFLIGGELDVHTCSPAFAEPNAKLKAILELDAPRVHGEWRDGDTLECVRSTSDNAFNVGQLFEVQDGHVTDCYGDKRRIHRLRMEGVLRLHVPPAFDEARADIIGQNGNDGLHYAVPAGVDIDDWRTWQVGDKLECIEAYSDGDDPEDSIALHEIVTVVEIEPPGYGGDLPIKVQGTAYFGWPNHADYAAEEGSPPLQLFRFHHRPTKTDE